MAPKTKVCRRKDCLKTKPLTDFPSDAREKDGHSVWCKECWSKYQAARKALKAGGKSTKAVKPASKSTKPVAKAGKPVAKQATKVVKKTAVKSARPVKTDPEVS